MKNQQELKRRLYKINHAYEVLANNGNFQAMLNIALEQHITNKAIKVIVRLNVQETIIRRTLKYKYGYLDPLYKYNWAI